MSKKSTETIKKNGSFKNRILQVFLIILIPVTLFGSWKLGNGRYYICSLLLILYAIGIFFLRFEKRKPQARELVTLAVMCAIAVISRAVFMMLPNFKPLVGIVMITAIAFGAEAGFLTGAVSGFVSNFLFGQGPWTPWQMFAFGIGGFLAGLLALKKLMDPEKKLQTAILGALIVLCIVGPLLDTSTFFMVSAGMNTASAGAVYLSGLPVNAVHALATFLTLFFLCRPINDKLERLKIKYGMMGDSNEI